MKLYGLTDKDRGEVLPPADKNKKVALSALSPREAYERGLEDGARATRNH